MIISRIGIGSAFRIGAVMGLVYMVVSGLFMVLSVESMSSQFTTSNGYTVSQPGSGSYLMVFLCGLPLGAVFGGLSAAFSAFIFNLAAGWAGGLEIEISEAVYTYQPSVQRSAPLPYSQSDDHSDWDVHYKNPWDK